MASQPIALGSYVPAVDGLRALAVAGVIVHHLGMFGFASDIGWAGVWLFFVISGFVITNSVDGVAYRGQSFSRKLSIFWARRVRRILPLYLLMIGVGTIIVLTVPGLRYQVEQLPYLLTFTYNFHRLSPDYSHTKLFGHYWSLSVEEQFYLLFPLIYFSVAGRARVAILVGVVLLAPGIRWIVGEVAGATISPASAPLAVAMFSPGHFDAFALGALIAIFRERIARWRFSLPLAAASTGVLLAGYLAACVAAAADKSAGEAILAGFQINASGTLAQVGLYCVLNVLFATLVVGAVVGWRPLAIPLATAPMRYLGRISYGLYVVHFPLLAVLLGNGDRSVGALEVALYLGTLLAICHLLYVYFERPIMEQRWGKWRWGRPGTAAT